MRKQIKSMINKHSSIFNPIWPLVYPLVRRVDGYIASSRSDNQSAFNAIYEENYWGSSESRSGPGSTVEYTKALRKSLEKLTLDLRIGVLLDAPCGDFNWMQHVRLPDNCRYIGGEIVAPLVAELERVHAGPSRHFRLLDIVNDELPEADLWLCRDVLFHLPTADIIKTLKNFTKSNITHLLTTTFDFQKFNDDVKPGGFRCINLRKPPFSLPKPILKISDFVAPAPPRYLALWSHDQVAASLK